MSELKSSVKPAARRVEIFRASDAKDIAETDMMKPSPPPPAERAAFSAVLSEGRERGTAVRVLSKSPSGLSLVYAWFKSLYPLPPHSHDADCMYYVVSGELTMGTETLRAGDGLFVPANTFYSFTAGPEGVEILEFRAADAFDTVVRAGSAAAWERAASVVQERLPHWKSEPTPSDRHNVAN